LGWCIGAKGSKGAVLAPGMASLVAGAALLRVTGGIGKGAK
jgi:hypothetical protein